MPVVALVDDHELFRTALALALQAHGMEVLEPALTSMADLKGALTGQHVDVALVDRDLGGLGDGEELIEALVARRTSVLVISGNVDDVTKGRCLAAGAAACLPKTVPLDTVLQAVVASAAGQRVTPPVERDRLVACWLRQRAADAATRALFDRLTAREEAILARLVDGRTVQAIAADTFVSEATVRTQVRSILLKLEVTSQLEAVGLARRSGWSEHR